MCQSYEQSCDLLHFSSSEGLHATVSAQLQVFAIRSHSYREPDEGMGQTQILVPLDEERMKVPLSLSRLFYIDSHFIIFHEYMY